MRLRLLEIQSCRQPLIRHMELAYCDVRIANSRPHFEPETKLKGSLPVLPLAGKYKNGVEKLITTVVGTAAVLTVARGIEFVIVEIFDAYVLVMTDIFGPSCPLK